MRYKIKSKKPTTYLYATLKQDGTIAFDSAAYSLFTEQQAFIAIRNTILKHGGKLGDYTLVPERSPNI